MKKSGKAVKSAKSVKNVTFGYSQAFSEGWKLTKKKYWPILGVLAVVVLVSFLTSMLTNQMGEGSLLFSVLTGVVNLFVSVAVLKALLQISRDKEIDVSVIWEKIGVVVNYFLASFVIGVIVVLGLIFFIVPGIYFALKYMFATLFVVDKEVGPMEALRMSAEATKDQKFKLFGLTIVLAFMNILAAFTVVGLLFTVPLSAMVQMWVYNRLMANAR